MHMRGTVCTSLAIVITVAVLAFFMFKNIQPIASATTKCEVQLFLNKKCPNMHIGPECSGHHTVISANNITVWRSLLYDFADVAVQVGLPFWLSEGTALGAVRENDLIEGDTDVDVGVYFSDFKRTFPAAWPLLQARGYTVMRFCPFSIQKCVDGMRYYMDIDITQGGMSCMAYSYPTDCTYHLSTIEKFVACEVHGRAFKCPSMEYIRFLYGDKWHVKSQTKPTDIR